MMEKQRLEPVYKEWEMEQTMFKNYLKTALRNILKYKIFSLINIFGLAVAMTVSMLIILMLADQTEYDQFQVNKERIYRILTQRLDGGPPNATTAFPLAAMLKTDYPVIEEATHLVSGVGGDATYNKKIMEMRGFFADPAFLNVFSYPLEKGDRATALQEPNSMVISREIANKLFGDEDPLGKTVSFVNRGLHFFEIDLIAMDSPPLAWGNYKITAVLAERNYKSHLKFDVLVSAASMPALYENDKIKNLTDDWKTYSRCYTYVLLKPGINEKGLAPSLDDIVKRKYSDIDYLKKDIALVSQRLTAITPGRFVGNPSSLSLPIEVYYFLSFLAVILMILACLNYTNLSVARALTRAKEIGVRKVNGASRKDLILQFLSESILTALLSLILAASLLYILKPGFMSLWVNRYLNFNLQESVDIYLIFAGFALIVGIIAGFFPALTMSKYQPVKVLTNLESIRPGKLGLRKIMSISQFVVSLFFIVTSILMYNQVQHFLGFEYGFISENIINIAIQGNDHKLIANELRSVPGVSNISASAYLPATGVSHSKKFEKINSDESVDMGLLEADEHFMANLGLKIIAGRNLPAADEGSNNLIVVNETAARKLGYKIPSEILGHSFLFEGQTVEVIGLMRDFYFRSPMFSKELGPLMLRNQPEEFTYINVKVTTSDVKKVVADLQTKWQHIDPVHPFKYYFYDEQIATINQSLGDLFSILSFMAFLAVTIACLGLLGMALYTTERRRKEIGIRKALGAEEKGIALLLSKEYLKMLLISILIASPLSYFVNNAWLQNFPNRVDFGFGTVVLGALILLVLGLVTIGSQTLKAARSNPVDSLRME
jgi:putative ABC transport system permease protein